MTYQWDDPDWSSVRACNLERYFFINLSDLNSKLRSSKLHASFNFRGIHIISRSCVCAAIIYSSSHAPSSQPITLVPRQFFFKKCGLGTRLSLMSQTRAFPPSRGFLTFFLTSLADVFAYCKRSKTRQCMGRPGNTAKSLIKQQVCNYAGRFL